MDRHRRFLAPRVRSIPREPAPCKILRGTPPLVLLLGLLSACDLDRSSPLLPESPESVRAAAPLHASSQGIPGQYIVVFEPSVRDAPGLARALLQAHGGTGLHTYQYALRGFAARLSPEAVQALQRNPNVAYIEQDGVASSDEVQVNATWGLDRIDQRNLPLSTTYEYTADGTGVTVYVLDSGIRTSHNEFAPGRASVGLDVIDDGQNGQDCYGHGTEVAGTVAGTTYGVAKNARVVAVRILDCGGDGELSGVIGGIDWVTGNHERPAVANMSLGTDIRSVALNDAVAASTAAGVTYVVSAGNDDRDACLQSPASAPEAVTVGATDSDDARSWFSNWGTCVDLFAPGSKITTAGSGNDSGTTTGFGTSLAAPHVSGVAALYLQSHPDASPAEVTTAILATATTGVIADVGTGSPNRLLFSGPTEFPQVASIALNPTLMAFGTLLNGDGEPGSASSAFELRNDGTAPLEWTASSSAAWLDVSPGQGTLAPGTVTLLTATIDVSTTKPGVHRGAITVVASDVFTSPRSMAVTVEVVSLVAPSDLTVTPVSASQIDLTWTDNSSNETEFALERRMKLPVNTWGEWAGIGVTAADETAFSDTDVGADQTYQYRVHACADQGCSGWATSPPVETPKQRGRRPDQGGP